MAVAVLPAFIAMMVAAMMVQLALRALPVADGPRETIQRIAGMLQKFSLTCLTLFFLTLMIATTMAAFEGQRSFEAFKAEQMRR